MSITPYLDLIPSQHRDKQKFIAWLTAVLEKGEATITVVKSIPDAFDIENAVGKQLDTQGELIGRTRYLPFQLDDGTSPVLDDENYRTALKAKIARNQWDGTIPQIHELWDTLFPDAKMRIKDNQNMSMKAIIRGELGLESVHLVTVGYIIPKPFGVRLDIAWESELDRTDYVGMMATTRDTVQITCQNPES